MNFPTDTSKIHYNDYTFIEMPPENHFQSLVGAGWRAYSPLSTNALTLSDDTLDTLTLTDVPSFLYGRTTEPLQMGSSLMRSTMRAYTYAKVESSSFEMIGIYFPLTQPYPGTIDMKMPAGQAAYIFCAGFDYTYTQANHSLVVYPTYLCCYDGSALGTPDTTRFSAGYWEGSAAICASRIDAALVHAAELGKPQMLSAYIAPVFTAMTGSPFLQTMNDTTLLIGGKQVDLVSSDVRKRILIVGGKIDV